MALQPWNAIVAGIASCREISTSALRRRFGALNGTRACAAVLVFGAVTALAIGLLSSMGPSRAQTDRGTYFRLKVDVDYRGKPVPFDIVVGCNVRIGRLMDQSRTYEVGLIPSIFGKRMEDGKGLVVRPPDACRGQTTDNGIVPEDLLPVLVVYENADNLAFGTAYVTEDAYENSLSVLKFKGARIEAATKVDFEEFRRSQQNLVTPQMYLTIRGDAALKEAGLVATDVRMGDVCYGAAKFSVTGESERKLKAEWPSSKPLYWASRTVYVESRDLRREGSATVGGWYTLPLDSSAPNFGMSTRGGGGSVGSGPKGKHKGYLPSEVYPNIGPWIAMPWPHDVRAAAFDVLGTGPYILTHLDARDRKTKGLAYCWSAPASYAPIGASQRDTEIASAYYKLKQPDRINSVKVEEISENFGPGYSIIQNDSHIFRRFHFYLGSTRGGV